MCFAMAIAIHRGTLHTVRTRFLWLEYAPEIQEVQVADGWAIEWGYFDATYKMSANDTPVSTRRKGLRVLKRQSDGSHEFSRKADAD
jgi:hypothetical protein